MFPLIFIISVSFLTIAFLTSKLQNESTNILISIYSALGPVQTAAISLTTAIFISNGHPQIMIKILLIAALAIIFLVNLMGYIVQTPFLLTDRKFLKWANRISRKQESRSNLIWFHVISLLSFFTSYKLKMILFSRLFNFQCFKFQLQNISKFKVFNVLSFIGYFPEILSLYCCISALAYSTLSLQQLLLFVDLLIIVVLNMAFSLLIIKKDEQFFTDTQGGLPTNKIFNLAEEMSSSTHMIARKERENKQKRRIQLYDISEFDEYAYTSTKRERNTKGNAFKDKKQKDEDGYYFQDDSDNTGSKIHSEVSNEQSPHLPGNADRIDDQQQEQGKTAQNILNIDDFYEDESMGGVKNLEPEAFNHPIVNQKPLILEQILSGFNSQEEEEQKFNKNRQIIGTNNNQQQTPISTHTKLSEYLISVQKNGPRQQKQSTNEQTFKVVEKQIDSGEERESEDIQENFMMLINESALIESQSSNVPMPNSPQFHQQLIINKYQQEAAKKIVQRVISAHHSPKKVIQIQGDDIPTNINALSNSISINEHHDEKPIRNKSAQKAKKQQNHPINAPSPTHPIYGQKASKTEEEDESEIEKPQGKRAKIQAKQPIMATAKIQQGFFEHLPIDQSQQDQPQVPRPKFYQQFIHQTEQSSNSFKRSFPQSLAQFSKNNRQNKTVIEHSAGNSMPRKPVQHLFNDSDNGGSNNESRFLLKRNFQQAVKFNGRERPLTGKQGRLRNFTLERRPQKGLEGKKMLSLEKIYLQRLSNF